MASVNHHDAIASFWLVRTVRVMPHTTPRSNPALQGLSRSLTERPTGPQHVAAKRICSVRPEAIARRVADPAVLVDVHPDRRVSLRRLVGETGVELAESYTVTLLATGCVDLAPTAEIDASGRGSRIEVRVDGRDRLCLTKGLVHRLAVPAGGKLLVSLAAPGGSLRLLDLATCADAVDQVLTSSEVGTVADAEGERR